MEFSMLEIIEVIGLMACATGVSLYGIYQINLSEKRKKK
jgi:hypothetical protein|tara:strand:- start:414 stop:530 length:117 start_codon:yes stop_codon:yes gene_type:complete